MKYCELLNKNKSLLGIQEWLIVVNLAIKYLLTNFYIKKNSQNCCNFYGRSLNIQIFKEIKNIDFCETYISETLVCKLKLCESWAIFIVLKETYFLINTPTPCYEQFQLCNFLTALQGINLLSTYQICL